jgi:hypothetical protein
MPAHSLRIVEQSEYARSQISPEDAESARQVPVDGHAIAAGECLGRSARLAGRSSIQVALPHLVLPGAHVGAVMAEPARPGRASPVRAATLDTLRAPYAALHRQATCGPTDVGRCAATNEAYHWIAPMRPDSCNNVRNVAIPPSSAHPSPPTHPPPLTHPPPPPIQPRANSPSPPTTKPQAQRGRRAAALATASRPRCGVGVRRGTASYASVTGR